MMRRVSTAVVCILVCAVSAPLALRLENPIPLEIGGRFSYGLRVQRYANEFPWNLASNTAGDHTRLMLDVTAGEGRPGELYLKSAAFRESDDKAPGQKLLHFEQGDYFWRGRSDRSELRVRLFANERRFFTHSFIAPLMDDDRTEEMGDNLGARVDGSLFNSIGITALYSALGNELERSSKIAYVRTTFAHHMFAISTAYAHENKADERLLDEAIIKTELSAYYKKATMIVAYEQSGRGCGLFFPTGRFHFERYIGDNFSRVLPDEGAFFAEARIAGLAMKQWGSVNLVHRYFALKSAFSGQYIEAGSGTSGYTTGVYFLANEISLNGRIVYGKRTRSKLESEREESIEASVWARLKNDSEVFLRGGLSETSGSFPYVDEHNYIHGAWRYAKKKLRTGVHLMLKDMDTIYSERRFACDAKLSFGGNMAVYWRAVIAQNADPKDVIYARFEYRPNRRLFLTAGYGRSIFGDDPFLLEDADISALIEDTPQYTFSLRGDF
jgi:hypothetical protein